MQFTTSQLFQMANILTLHGKAKGMSTLLKNLRRHNLSSVESLQARMELAQHDYRSMGHYEDCGDYYHDKYVEAKAQLDLLTPIATELEELVQDIIHIKLQCRDLKRQYLADYGAEALQLLQAAIDEQGHTQHRKTFAALKARKLKCARIERVMQYLHGHNCHPELTKLLQHARYDGFRLKSRPWSTIYRFSIATRRDLKADFKRYIRINADVLHDTLTALLTELDSITPANDETQKGIPLAVISTLRQLSQ